MDTTTDPTFPQPASLRAAARWATAAGIAWTLLSIESIARPDVMDYRDVAFLVPWLLTLATVAAIHRIQGDRLRRAGRVAFRGVVASMAAGALGSVALLLGWTGSHFAVAVPFWVLSMAVYGTATARAGVLPRWIGVALALSEVLVIATAVALSPWVPLSDHGSFSGAIAHGVVFLAIGRSLAAASRDGGPPAGAMPDLTVYRGVHRALRDGGDALATAAPAAADDRAQARALATYWAGFEGELRVHHRVEDEHVFPAIRERLPHAGAVLDRLDADHHELDAVLARCRRAVTAMATGRGDSGDARAAFDALRGHLHTHLDVEDAEVLPLLERHFTHAEWSVQERAASRSLGSVRQAAFTIPFLLRAFDDATRARLLAEAPMLARVVWGLGHRRHARLTARALLGSPVPDRGRFAGSSRARRAAAVVLAAAAAVVAGCGDTDAATSTSARPSAGAAPAASLAVVAEDHTFDLDTTTVVAGRTPLTLTNRGAQPHQLMVVRLPVGTSLDDLVAAGADGPAAAAALVDHAGGINAVQPGATATGYADLQPGSYAVLCFIPLPDGGSHLHEGMAAALTVVPGDAAPTPDAVGEIALDDFAFGLPEAGLATPGAYRVRNDGAQDHEMVVMRIEEGKTMADVAAFLQAGFAGTPPVTFAGGAGGVEPGADSYIDLDLPAGEYVAMCFITDPETGQPHAVQGMVSTFTIPAG